VVIVGSGAGSSTLCLFGGHFEVYASLARFVATHALTCFYTTEALRSLDSGLIIADDKIVGGAPPLHNLKTFFKLASFRSMFSAGWVFVLARRQLARSRHGEVGSGFPSISVVDPSSQVHGVGGLFVVDVSMLPFGGSGQPCADNHCPALRGDHMGWKALNVHSIPFDHGFMLRSV
jgi:hypothetical protein